MTDTMTVQLDNDVLGSLVRIGKWLDAHADRIAADNPVAGAYVRSAVVCVDDAHDLLERDERPDDTAGIDERVERDQARRHNMLCVDDEGRQDCDHGWLL